MDQQQSAIDGLSFHLAEDGRTLQAVFSPVESKQPLDAARLRHVLVEQGFHTLYLLEPALTELIRKYETATQPFVQNIGERKDAHVAVTIAPDNMSASVAITPPFGGRVVDRQLVLDALRAAGVISGILDANIDEAVALGQVEDKQVARGREPVNGVDASFESLVPAIRERRPAVDEHGMVDYRNLGQFVSVKAGDPLMRRKPATPGVAGENVRGAAIPATSGKDTYFAPGLKGATFAADDANLLVAAIAGQPVLTANGVMVEPSLAVKNVDLSTGNVDFEGTINIAGDVKAGMKIKASGDVTISGMVEAAEIQAGGDIIIKGGVIGNGRREQVRAKDDAGDDHSDLASRHDVAYLHCGGSLSAHFIENAYVEAGNCIIVDELVLQSELTAINQIVVGKEGSKKGHIVGGIVRATLLVQAIILGSAAEVHTTIEVGVNPLLHSKLQALARQLQQKEKQLDDIIHVLVFARENPKRINPELLQKTERTGESLRLDIAALTQEKEALQTQMSLADGAKVVVRQKTFGGVKVRIGEKIRQVENDLGPGTFRLLEGEIAYGNV